MTIGVYVKNGAYSKDLGMFMMILLAEFAGAFLGVFWTWLVLMPSYIEEAEQKSIPMAWLVPLCPVGVSGVTGDVILPCDTDLDRDRGAAFFQLFGTFIFVFLIMIVKSKPSFISGDDFLGALSVALCLLS